MAAHFLLLLSHLKLPQQILTQLSHVAVWQQIKIFLFYIICTVLWRKLLELMSYIVLWPENPIFLFHVLCIMATIGHMIIIVFCFPSPRRNSRLYLGNTFPPCLHGPHVGPESLPTLPISHPRQLFPHSCPRFCMATEFSFSYTRQCNSVSGKCYESV